jgi:hypothetical protein
MTWQLWLDLHLHFCMLSLLAVGGALAIVPEMHRYLVNELQLLSETAFSQSVTLSQIAPGPNILLVAVMGWNIGLQAAGGGHGFAVGFEFADRCGSALLAAELLHGEVAAIASTCLGCSCFQSRHGAAGDGFDVVCGMVAANRQQPPDGLAFAADMRSQYVDRVVHPRTPLVADVGWSCAGCGFGLVR